MSRQKDFDQGILSDNGVVTLELSGISRISHDLHKSDAHGYDRERAIAQVRDLLHLYGNELDSEIKNQVTQLLNQLEQKMREEKMYMPSSSNTFFMEKILTQLDRFLIFWTDNAFVDFATQSIH